MVLINNKITVGLVSRPGMVVDCNLYPRIGVGSGAVADGQVGTAAVLIISDSVGFGKNHKTKRRYR